MTYVEFNAEGDNDIWFLRMREDGAPEAFLNTSNDETQPAVSPNGRFIAYRSNQSGQDDVYVSSFPDPGAFSQRVSLNGGMEPRWSHDGRELYYRSGTHMMAIPVAEGPGLELGNPRVLFLDGYRTLETMRSPGYDVTADGRFVVFEEAVTPQIWAGVVFDLATELERLVPSN